MRFELSPDFASRIQSTPSWN